MNDSTTTNGNTQTEALAQQPSRSAPPTDSIDQLRRNRESLQAEVKATGSTVKGRVCNCPHPQHEDKHPSAEIRQGGDGIYRVRCYSCDFSGDIFDLRAALEGRPVADVLREARTGHTRHNGNGHPPQQTKSDNSTTAYSTANEAAATFTRKHGQPSRRWVYHDVEGTSVGVVLRWDMPGGKTIRPVSLHPSGWQTKAMPQPRPLYQLPELSRRASETVYVGEGENVADAAASLGLLATTSPGGSKAAGMAGWMPLSGRDVVIVPDNDQAGERYAEEVSKALRCLDTPAMVRIVRLSKLSEGGDLADLAQACEDETQRQALREQIEKLAAEAEPETDAVGPANGPVLTRLADVEPEPIHWLWPQRVAIGKLTLLAGDPGLGKSFVTLDMAARLSSGSGWPDNPNAPIGPGGVVLLSAEDDPGDTIRPRLDAAGADVSRITALQGIRTTDDKTGQSIESAFCLAGDLPHLETAIDKTPDCRLVVIDPVTAYLGKTDSHKNAELRSVLAPLADLARRRGVAVVAVSHLNKSAGGSAMYRTMGSLAFVAAARAAWAVTKDKDDPARRLVLPIKNNLAQDVDGLAYQLTDGGRLGPLAVAWEADPVSVTADDALSEDAGEDDDRSERDHAGEWLRDALADEPLPAKEIQRMAKDNGFSVGTLRRAKDKAGVEAEKHGYGADGTWVWTLPAQRCATTSKGAHPESLRTLGETAHLRENPDGEPPPTDPSQDHAQDPEGEVCI